MKETEIGGGTFMDSNIVDAIVRGDYALTRKLLVNHTYSASSKLRPLIIWAAQEVRLKIIKPLLLKGESPNAIDSQGFTVLQTAVPYPEIVCVLIQQGAKLNHQSRNGTALHSASAYGYYESAKLLLTNGAVPDIFDKDGYTPLMYAVRYRDEMMMELLIEHGASPLRENKRRESAFTIARRHRAIRMLKQAIS